MSFIGGGMIIGGALAGAGALGSAAIANSGKKGGGFSYPNAGQIYGQATDWAKNTFPEQFGAQTGALRQMATPESVQQYYQGFQPTSFEQALASQNFQNIWPDQQAYMNNILSKSGMMYSPVAATTLGNAYGNTAFNIGQYLDQQANARANTSLQARLGINPMDYVTAYANTAVGQGNQQANANYATSMASQLGQQQQLGQLGSTAGTLLGNYMNQNNQNQIQQQAYQNYLMNQSYSNGNYQPVYMGGQGNGMSTYMANGQPTTTVT